MEIYNTDIFIGVTSCNRIVGQFCDVARQMLIAVRRLRLPDRDPTLVSPSISLFFFSFFFFFFFIPMGRKNKPPKTESKEKSKKEENEEERIQRIAEEVQRRKAAIEASIRPKPPAEPHQRILFYPFAYALREEFLQNYCWYCLLESQNLRKCSKKCERALFCDEKCESMARKDHKAECEGFRRLNSKTLKNEEPDVEVRLLGRIAHRFKQIQKGEDKKIADFYKNRESRRTIMEIWSHENEFERNERYKTQFDDIYKKLISFYKEKDLPKKEEIFRLHCRDFVNRHAISDRLYQNEIGKGLYLDLCEYDHSCSPDTVFYSVGFSAVLISLNRRSDISDPRKSFYSTHSQRQKQLFDSWFFECKCNRCLDPKDHLLTAVKCFHCYQMDSVETAIAVQGSLAKKEGDKWKCPECSELQEPFHVMEANYLMRDIDAFLDASENFSADVVSVKLRQFISKSDLLLPQVNVYRARAILRYVGVAEDSVDRAAIFASTEKCLRHCFPAFHPGLGFFFRDLSELCSQHQYYGDAVKYTIEAMDILERIFVEHKALDELRQILPDLQKKEAMQIQSGKQKSLPKDNLKPSQLQRKPSNGSTKERAQHRKNQRAPTPLPPVSSESVQFE